MKFRKSFMSLFVFMLLFVFVGCGSDNGSGEFVAPSSTPETNSSQEENANHYADENNNTNESNSSQEEVESNLTKTKGYLIDSPLHGVTYLCDGNEGLTNEEGLFECVDVPVTFKVGNLTLGTLTAFTADGKVYPQDLLGLERDNYSNARLKLLARLLQSLDDDGNIETTITITQGVRDAITKEQEFKDLTANDVSSLLSGVGKSFVNECGAMKHLGDKSVNCNSDGSYYVEDTYVAPVVTPTSTSQKRTITGYVVDDPITGATIEVYDTNQIFIEKFKNTSDKNGNFSIAVDKKYSLPLFLKVTGGKLKGEDFNDVMYGFCFEKTCNITPITTTLSLSFIGNLASSKKEDFSKFASDYLGISDWQSISQNEIVNFRKYMKDNEQGLEHIASVIASDIADGYIDNVSFKAIFPNAKFREEKVNSFEIDKDSIKNVANRNLKLMNLMTGEESDIDGSVSYKSYGLELALVEKLEYELYDGTPKTKIDIVYLPFEEYSETKLDSYSTIFSFVFKDTLLLTLSPSTKKELVNVLMTKYTDELKELVAIHLLYINKGDMYLKDFENGVEKLQTLLKEEYTNSKAIIEHSTSKAMKSKQIQKMAKAYRKNEVYTDFMSLGGIALKHKQTGGNGFVVGNILPAYWGLTSYEDYKTFIADGGDDFFNVTTLPSTFNHNLITPNSGGGIGLAFSATLKAISSSKNFANGLKTPMNCEEFDGTLCDGTTLYSNQKREYVFYKDMRLSSLQGVMNDLDVLKPIVGAFPPKFKEKVDEVIKKAKKAEKVIETVSDTISTVSLVVDSTADILEIINNSVISDKDIKEKLQEDINSFKNVKGNIDEVVDLLSSFSLHSQNSLKDTQLEKIWSKPKDTVRYLELLGFKNIANATSLLRLPSSAKNTKVKAKYMITALILHSAIGNQEVFEKEYARFSTKDGAIFFKTDNLLEQIYLMINSLAIKKVALKKVYVKTLKESKLIDSAISSEPKYVLGASSSKVASLLFKGSLTAKTKSSELKKIPNMIMAKVTDLKSKANFVKFVTGKIDDISFMDIKSKMNMIVENIIVPILYNSADSATGAVKNLLVKKLIMIATPQGASVALVEAGNEVAGKLVSMTAYPNKIAFNLETKEDGKVYFSSLIPTVTGFKKYIKPEPKRMSAFLQASGEKNPFVIVTKDGKDTPPSYRPVYRTEFMGTTGLVETFLDDEVNENKFIDIFWEYDKCTENAISEHSVDISKCKKFKDNELSVSYTGEELDNDFSISRDSFLKKSKNGNAYLDFFDILAFEVCKDSSRLGFLGFTCDESNSNFNVYNKTTGIFMDILTTKLFNIEKKKNGSVVDSPKITELFFKIVDKSKIDIDVTKKEDNIIIKNSSNIDFSIIIVKSSELGKFYTSSYKNIEKVIKAHETLTLTLQEIELYLGKEEGEFDIDILAVDNILESYKRYLGDISLLATLAKMKPKGISTLKSFIDEYSNESSQTYAFIKKEHISLEKVNHRPTIEPIEIIGDKQPAPAEVTFNIKVTDEDDDALECWIKYTKDSEAIKLDSCEETVKYTYDKDGSYQVEVIARDEYGLEATYYDRVYLFNKNLDVVMLVDLSGSYSDDLSTFRAKSQEIVDAIKTQLPEYDLKIGITSFDDYPIYPYGSSGDFAFRKELDLTNNIESFKNKLNTLRIYNGGDGPEAQLEGIYQTIKQITWDDNAQKIILFFTDASFHDKDKYAEDSSYPGHGSIETKALIDSEGVYVIGLASGRMTEDMNQISDFEALMSSDSSEVVEKILEELSVFSTDKISSKMYKKSSSTIKIYSKDEYLGEGN